MLDWAADWGRLTFLNIPKSTHHSPAHTTQRAVDEAGRALRADPAAAFAHPYPPTALAFSPDRSGAAPDLLASCGDHVRLWRLGPGGTTLEALLAAGPDRGAAAPLTAMDWCEADARRLVAASVDTTCTVWDVERGTVEARLIGGRWVGVRARLWVVVFRTRLVISAEDAAF